MVMPFPCPVAALSKVTSALTSLPPTHDTSGGGKTDADAFPFPFPLHFLQLLTSSFCSLFSIFTSVSLCSQLNPTTTSNNNTIFFLLPPSFVGMGSSTGNGSSSYDYSFKILLVGDSGVGKSSLLLSFISNHVDNPSPTIGVDFKIKLLTVDGKKLKLTIWDTAGQERFRTLTTSYYRAAQGIILVYDVTRRETFTNLSDVWAKEVELYSTNPECIKILVGNKVDKENERLVSREEGIAFAQEYGCLFLECSAKTRENVHKCFEELALKILKVPSLLEEGSTIVKRNILKQKQEQQPENYANSGGSCCS